MGHKGKQQDAGYKKGRGFVPFAQVPAWVILARTISGQARTLYGLLVLHLNAARGDDEVYASQQTLAEEYGTSQSSIHRWLDELIELGAVELVGKNPNGCNVYLVHLEPPTGHVGFMDLAECSKARKECTPMVARIRKPRSTRKPVTCGDSPVNNPADRPVDHAGMNTGVPASECKLDVLSELEELTPPTPTPAATDAPAGVEEEELINIKITTLAHKAREMHPRWSLHRIEAALRDEEIRDLPWPLVEAAALDCFADPATFSPKRLLAETGAWWRRAERKVMGAGRVAGDGAAVVGVRADGWCGACVRRSRKLLIIGLGGDRWVDCPSCSSAAVPALVAA